MNPDQTYTQLLTEAQENPEIIGIVFGGSRGKDESFVTENSDYDVIVVVVDNASQEIKDKIKSLESDKFEVWAKTLQEFKDHAAWGTQFAWDRYNFAHNKAVLDKTGELQNIIDQKSLIPDEVKKEVVENALDSYINSVYRSAKYWRDGNDFPALIDASESLIYLMDALYALEGRVKPYNKYFEWELRNHPLKLLPWNVDEFITDYKAILTTGDIKTQEKIFTKIKELFATSGFSNITEDWKGKYFVG